MGKDTAASIQVIERMAAILDQLACTDHPSTLRDLAQETGLHPSTVHRILATLVALGYVERTGEGVYRLGVKLLQLGSRVHHLVDLRKEAMPVMEALRDRLGETVNLAVQDGDSIVYLERVSGIQSMRVELAVGARAPLHVTGVGKLFLGEQGEAACRAYAERSGLPPLTVNSIDSVDVLIREAEQARAAGFAIDAQENEEGIACIAAPVRDGAGRLVAGLSVSAPAQRLAKSWVDDVREAGLTLSRRLGFAG